MDRISVSKMSFVDSLGRVRIFNGMNIDDKLLDRKEFRYTLDDEFFRKFVANGLDIIRLAVTWQNLEPQMGVYNESYLKSIDAIFERASKYGVYILLDMHQDLYSGNGGKSCGDGAPEWATITDGKKPRQPIFVWADGYFFGRWVMRSFDNFWNNTPVDGVGLQDRYCRLWQMLAARYGESEALFGFDLMNEPFPGSDSKKMFATLIKSAARAVLFSDKIERTTLFRSVLRRDSKTLLDCIGGDVIRDIVSKVDGLSARFDEKKYSPFLNKTTAAIRQTTENGIVMMEQSYLCNSGVKQSVPPITVNGKREKNQCFGPHAYDMTVDTPLYKYANSSRVKAFFTEIHNTQKRLEVPVIVGEWGGCSDNTDTSWFPHAYELLNFFDERQWGQIYWDYHGDDLDKPLMQMMCRTHPVAIAGENISYGFDRDSNVFSLRFTSDKKGETLIFVHKPFETDAKYKTVEKYFNGASLISVPSVKGENRIVITVKD